MFARIIFEFLAVSDCYLLFSSATWPDPVDRLSIVLFIATVLLLPIVGYWLMVLDIRARLRALRGALVRIVNPRTPFPDWVRHETPACIRALGLTLPCTEEEVKRAYRRLAKELHPDRGGDVARFLQLQDHLEQAYGFLRLRDR